jgi:hypothetical protein
MFSNPFNFFPSVLFSNIYGLVFIFVYAVDILVVRRATQNQPKSADASKDRYSYAIIQSGGILGLAFREQAVISLGRSFSRVVAVKSDQRLVTTGSYRAYMRNTWKIFPGW